MLFIYRMRECSEDLLVELSEILFNELAFFRLMQDLDGPKKRTKQQLREWRQVIYIWMAFICSHRLVVKALLLREYLD